MKEMSSRQSEILSYIKAKSRETGYPPSITDIAEAIGGANPGTIHGYLKRLEKRGLLRRDPTKPRAIELLNRPYENETGVVKVPVLGRVTAGQPILAEENIEDCFVLPFSQVKTNRAYMLKVEGDSMKNAGIFDGDYVIVQKQEVAENRDIVVARIEDSGVTVKRFFREEGQIRLQPENDAYKPITVRQLQILGKVIGVFRMLETNENKNI